MEIESTKSRILQAAGPVFAAKGFDGATVREICESASVNVASINYYFGDKQNLYVESVREARRRRAEQFPFDENLDEKDPEEQLRDFIHTLLNRLVAMQSAPWEVQLLMREVLNPTNACRDLVEEYFRPFFDLLLGMIDSISRQKLSQPKIRQIGYSIIGQCLFYRYSAKMVQIMTEPQEFENYYDLEHLTNHIFSFSLAAIYHTDSIASISKN